MNALETLIQPRLTELQALCRRYGVKRLELFGSAAVGPFHPDRSDLDFLVEFFPEQPLGPWLTHYFQFRDALQRLFGRPVDLVLAGAAQNPHFRRSLEATRRPLYASEKP